MIVDNFSKNIKLNNNKLFVCRSVFIPADFSSLTDNATNLDCRDFGRDYFLCPEGRCIPRKSLCDYFIDCQNGEDEDTKMCGK